MGVWAPLWDYDGLPWELYRHLFWERQRALGRVRGLTFVQEQLVESALARCDKKTAEQFLIDWLHPSCRPDTKIKRFVPGAHFHVLGKKFDTYREAWDYAEKKGYRVSGFERHIVELDGD
jgi:hypothetical protein